MFRASGRGLIVYAGDLHHVLRTPPSKSGFVIPFRSTQVESFSYMPRTWSAFDFMIKQLPPEAEGFVLFEIPIKPN